MDGNGWSAAELSVINTGTRGCAQHNPSTCVGHMYMLSTGIAATYLAKLQKHSLRVPSSYSLIGTCIIK